jgi:hypothetical protein
MTVHRYLVTAPEGPRMDMWAATGSFANWLDGRDETFLVTCFDEDSEQFLAAARATAVTVQEIQGGGDTETYDLLVGEPGTGWAGQAMTR